MSRRLLKLLSFFLAGALVLVACGDDDSESEDAATTEAPAETTEAPADTVAEPTMDIVETASPPATSPPSWPPSRPPAWSRPCRARAPTRCSPPPTTPSPPPSRTSA